METALLSEIVSIIRARGPATAGTSNITDAAAIDTSDCDGVLFIADFGTLSSGAVTGLKAAQSDNASGTPDDFTDLAGSNVSVPQASGSDKIAFLDIHRPLKRYVRPIVTRSTGNAVLNNIIAIKYHGRKVPFTADASVVASKQLASPIEGTA